jgi:energy-converting hydrogenase Eha subunit A
LRLLERTSPQTSLSGLLGWYIADLNKWVAQIATGYALAVAMLIAGAFAIAVAVGVGAAACFHWLETCYGPYVAYGTLGGVFLLAGLVSVVIALRLLKRPNPPVPRPRRQARALKRASATPVVSRALTTMYTGNGTGPDKVTQALAGAAVALVGWIATSYARRSSRD